MFYKLVSNCKIVVGYRRSAIYDLQKESIYLIPNELVKIIKGKIFTIDALENKLSFESFNILKDLVRKEYFLCFNTISEFKYFPELKLEFEYPGLISNAIIYISNNSKTIEIINKLIQVGCYHFQLVFKNLTSKEQIDSFLIKTKHLPILSLDIVLSNPIKNILKINDNRILQFTIFNSKVNVKKNIQNKFILTRTNRNFKEEDETCKINLMDLKVNSLLFHESLAFNNYFNKKVVINEVGEIKNYYNQKSSFGNILNDNLKDVLQSSKFKKLWYVSKDQIIQCKNCEFKYSCVDDRIPKYKNKYYDFETPCNYDPFTLVWKKQ